MIRPCKTGEIAAYDTWALQLLSKVLAEYYAYTGEFCLPFLSDQFFHIPAYLFRYIHCIQMCQRFMQLLQYTAVLQRKICLQFVQSPFIHAHGNFSIAHSIAPLFVVSLY